MSYLELPGNTPKTTKTAPCHVPVNDRPTPMSVSPIIEFNTVLSAAVFWYLIKETSCEYSTPHSLPLAMAIFLIA